MTLNILLLLLLLCRLTLAQDVAVRLDLSSTVANGRRLLSINEHADSYGPILQWSSNDFITMSVSNHICSNDELALQDDNMWKDYCHTSLHLHGIVPLPNSVDGIPGITQPSIGPNQTVLYNFSIPGEVCGTFWYHSHSSVQYGDGARGVILVDCQDFQTLRNQVLTNMQQDWTDGMVQQQVITFSDWYSDWNMDILRGKVAPAGSRGDPDPHLDESMINGSTDRIHRIELQDETRFLVLRLVNTGMSGTQVFHIENHKMVIMEIDGVLVEPYELETLSMAVGQRYTVIVQLADTTEPIVAINGCNKMMGYIAKTILFHRQGDNNNIVERDVRIKDLPGFYMYELYQSLIPWNKTRWMPLVNTTVSNHVQLYYQYDRDEGTIKEYGTGVYKTNGRTLQEYMRDPIALHQSQDQAIEVIINSLDGMRHPWHLHGYKFQVISMGDSREGPLDLDDHSSPAWSHYIKDMEFWNQTKQTPMTRDTINIPGHSYVVLRFIPQYPGTWLLHCHVEWHMAKGLGAAFRITPPLLGDPEAKSVSKTTVLLVYSCCMLLFNWLLYHLLFSKRN